MDKRTYIYPDGSKYEGEWQNNKRHGQGILTRPDGMRYEGEWADGKPHGKGTLTSPNGKIRRGFWENGKLIKEQKPVEPKEDSLRELYISQNAIIKELEEHNQELEKKINFITNKGDFLERQNKQNAFFEADYFEDPLEKTEEKELYYKPLRGENEGSKRSKVWWIVATILLLLLVVFVVANFNGEIGTLYYDDGTIFYKGELKGNKPHGQGTVYHENGTIMYDGEFKDSEWHGQGKIYREDGTILYDGEFKGGMFHGQGKAYREGGIILYEGEYKENKWHGQGIVYEEDGTILYEGEFKNSEPVW